MTRARRVADLEGNDAYELIGVASTASRAEIRRAYRRAMVVAHPDLGGPQNQAKLINCALELLMDDRASYDEYRRRVARRVGQNSAGQDGAGQDGTGQDGTAENRPGEEWLEEWPETDADEEDPWAEADDGVGRPGQGADAPGAAERRRPADGGEPDEDDRVYRPFTVDSAPLPEPRRLGSLANTPMLLGMGVLFLVMVMVIANARNDPGPSYPTGGSVVLPSSLLYPTSYPYSRITGLPYPDPLASGSAVPGYPYRGLLESYLNPISPISPIDPDTLRLSPAPAEHRCSRSAAGQLRCSGSNKDGQLGAGDRRSHRGPVPVEGGQVWRAVTVGSRHTCAIRQDRTLWCWGANDDGQLGTGGGAQDRTVPRQISGGRTWRSVAALGTVTCAVRTTGTLWCWGRPTLNVDQLPTGDVPGRYGNKITWTTVRADGTRLCGERPGHRDTCWSV